MCWNKMGHFRFDLSRPVSWTEPALDGVEIRRLRRRLEVRSQ